MDPSEFVEGRWREPRLPTGRGVLNAARSRHYGRGLGARQPLRLRAVRREHSDRSGRRRRHPEGLRQT